MRLGVCYYPEHWPEDLWPGDARRMSELGIHWVRIGEFAWSRIEPEPGRFDWAWLDRAVETLTTLIEPIMIIVLGGLLLGVALALYIPMFDMGKVVSG